MNNLVDPAVNAIPSLPSSAPPPARAMLQISMSPRPPSALLSPSPLLLAATLEHVTPDRHVVPFCHADDVKDLALPGSNSNLISGSAPRFPHSVSEVNVVDEDHADVLFRIASKKRQPDPMSLALPSPKELHGGPFSGSSNLPTPNLSLHHFNQLQQRPTTSPPPLFQTNVNMALLRFASPTPPIPGSLPIALAEPELPDDLHRLRPLHTHFYGAHWQSQYNDQQKVQMARHLDDRSNSTSTLATSVETLPLSSTDNDSESSYRSKSEQPLWQDLKAGQVKRERTSAKEPVSMPSVSNLKPKTVPLKGSGEQPQCDLCGAHFARRSNLYKHKRSVHVNHRQFKCDICSYGFKRQDHLVKHKRSVHSKERNFPCEICGTAFAEKYNRAKHVRVIHFTQRPFKCGCGAYFQHRDQMLDCLRCKR